MQTGIFSVTDSDDLEDEEDVFADYSCPEMQPFMVRTKVHRYVAMASPAYRFIKFASGKNWTPFLDLAYTSAESLDQALAVYGSLYDGSDFCKGLVYSQIATKTAMRFAEYFRYLAFMKEYSNPPKHLMEEFWEKGARTMIVSHRGKDLGPENSFKGFKGILDTQTEGIEADVWLNKAGDPMVLHGHDSGALNQFHFSGERVFEWTTQELTDDMVDIGLGGRMPTLE